MKKIITALVIAAGSVTTSLAALPRADMRHISATVEMRGIPEFRHAFKPSDFWWLYEYGPAAFLR